MRANGALRQARACRPAKSPSVSINGEHLVSVTMGHSILSVLRRMRPCSIGARLGHRSTVLRPGRIAGRKRGRDCRRNEQDAHLCGHKRRGGGRKGRQASFRCSLLALGAMLNVHQVARINLEVSKVKRREITSKRTNPPKRKTNQRAASRWHNARIRGQLGIALSMRAWRYQCGQKGIALFNRGQLGI